MLRGLVAKETQQSVARHRRGWITTPRFRPTVTHLLWVLQLLTHKDELQMCRLPKATQSGWFLLTTSGFPLNFSPRHPDPSGPEISSSFAPTLSLRMSNFCRPVSVFSIKFSPEVLDLGSTPVVLRDLKQYSFPLKHLRSDLFQGSNDSKVRTVTFDIQMLICKCKNGSI